MSFTWEKIAEAIELSPEKTPLAHLLAFMQNETMKDSLRLQAAIAAAPYVHPKLSSIEIRKDHNEPMRAGSEIGAALASLAELMRQRKTIEADVIDVDERKTGRGDKAALITSDSVARDSMAQSGSGDTMAEPSPMLIEPSKQGGNNGR